MNIQQDISSKTFTEIKQLAAGHPVFLVTASDDVFVIKAEGSSSSKAVGFSAEVMNFVDPHAASRVLTKTEVMAVQRFYHSNPAALIEMTAGTLNNFVMQALRPPLPPMPGMRAPQVQQQAVMTIMGAKVKLNDIESAAEEALGGDKTKVKLFTKALNNSDNLKRLGVILAADAFNNNQDRVNFEPGGYGKKVGPTRLKCIWNPGNIFIADEKKRMTVIGLDHFDPNSTLNINPDKFESQLFYAGTLLRTDQAAARRTLLTNVADDIETLLGPRNRSLSILQQTRLPSGAVQKMEAGMLDGAAKILSFLKQKYAQGGMGPVMQQRIASIGWFNRTNFPKL